MAVETAVTGTTAGPRANATGLREVLFQSGIIYLGYLYARHPRAVAEAGLGEPPAAPDAAEG